MGRKGGGRAGFMKANRKGPESDDEEEVAPQQPAAPTKEEAKPTDASKDSKTEASAAPVISKKAAAFLVGSGDGSSDDSDGDEIEDRSASGETRGKMVQRHKRETKALKEQVKRLGKKGKDEAAKLEAEMKTRHAAELASLAPAGSSAGGAETIALADSLYAATLNEGGEAAPKKEKKLTKAQQRREKQAQKDAEREARIAAENAELGETDRMTEENALKKVLAPLGLGVKDIPPDGHCLYRSLEDQLNKLPENGAATVLTAAGCEDDVSFMALRQIAAEYMRKNADHFKHFIGDGDLTENVDGSGTTDADTAFEMYCNEVENTAAWGGHVEIEALSRALKSHIQVFSAGMTAVDVGEEFKESGGPTLQLCYLRHAYGLGEHYNSVKQKPKKPKKVTFEGDSSSEEEEEEDEEEEEQKAER